MPKKFRDIFESLPSNSNNTNVDVDVDDPTISKVGYDDGTNSGSPFYAVHHSGLRTNFRDMSSLANHLSQKHNIRGSSTILGELNRRIQQYSRPKDILQRPDLLGSKLVKPENV